MFNKLNEIDEFQSTIINKEEIDTNKKNNPFCNYIFYTKNNKIIGFIYFSEIYDRIEIDDVKVEKEHRNQKIASKMMEFLIEDYGNKGMTLEVRKNNEYAIKLYKKFNFKEVAIRKGYYNGIDGILMERKIKTL